MQMLHTPFPPKNGGFTRFRITCPSGSAPRPPANTPLHFHYVGGASHRRLDLQGVVALSLPTTDSERHRSGSTPAGTNHFHHHGTVPTLRVPVVAPPPWPK